MNKFYRKGELKDEKIVQALRQAAEDYENGEIIDALTEFEQDYK